MGFISQSHVPCQPAGSSLGTPLLPCRHPALPYRVPLIALGPLGLGAWPGVLLGGCLGSQSALSRGTQAGERGLGSLVPGPSEFLSPGAVGQGCPSPGTRGHGRKTDWRSPSCFSSFPFRSLEFHCHNLIYGVFYLREKARASLSCGFVFVACASGRESFPKHAGPWLSRGRASV